MLKLFAADGTVKQEFPGAVSVQYVGRKARLWSAKNVLAEVMLQDGETIADRVPDERTVSTKTPCGNKAQTEA